jgi:hypothetical protein
MARRCAAEYKPLFGLMPIPPRQASGAERAFKRTPK